MYAVKITTTKNVKKYHIRGNSSKYHTNNTSQKTPISGIFNGKISDHSSALCSGLIYLHILIRSRFNYNFPSTIFQFDWTIMLLCFQSYPTHACQTYVYLNSSLYCQIYASHMPSTLVVLNNAVVYSNVPMMDDASNLFWRFSGISLANRLVPLCIRKTNRLFPLRFCLVRVVMDGDSPLNSTLAVRDVSCSQ